MNTYSFLRSTMNMQYFTDLQFLYLLAGTVSTVTTVNQNITFNIRPKCMGLGTLGKCGAFNLSPTCMGLGTLGKCGAFNLSPTCMGLGTLGKCGVRC